MKEKQSTLLITAPLKGLAYIILLPLVGIFAIFILGIRKLTATLQLLIAKLAVAPHDNEPAGRIQKMK